jgi:hypothetical protein
MKVSLRYRGRIHEFRRTTIENSTSDHTYRYHSNAKINALRFTEDTVVVFAIFGALHLKIRPQIIPTGNITNIR